jgi:hypothetical protein
MQHFEEPTVVTVGVMERIAPEKIQTVHFCHICGRELHIEEILVCVCGLITCSDCLPLCRGT